MHNVSEEFMNDVSFSLSNLIDIIEDLNSDRNIEPEGEDEITEAKILINLIKNKNYA